MWKKLAQELYRAIQTDRTHEQLDVPPLSFFVLDSRINRTRSKLRFTTGSNLDRLLKWAKELEGPGVLVIGQPLFSDPGDWKDSSLAHFDQYADLVRALRRSNHDIVVLTGDVHFGRVASCKLNVTRGTRLYEVISSPMALLPGAHSRCEGNLGTFPTRPVSGVPPQSISRHRTVRAVSGDAKRTEDHFMTVSFRDLGDGVRMRVRAWLPRRKPPTNSELPKRDWTYETILR